MCLQKFQTSSKNCIGGRLPPLSTKLITDWIYFGTFRRVGAGGVFGLSSSTYVPPQPRSFLFLLRCLMQLLFPMTNQTKNERNMTRVLSESLSTTIDETDSYISLSTPCCFFSSSNFVLRDVRENQRGSRSWTANSFLLSLFSFVLDFNDNQRRNEAIERSKPSSETGRRGTRANDDVQLTRSRVIKLTRSRRTVRDR